MFPLLGNRRRLSADIKLLGRWGEKRCLRFLKNKGMKLLTQNFSCKTGEIDLIMVDSDRSIVFVEVKTRRDESFGPVEDVITRTKKTRAIRTARYFLATNNIDERPFRFDVVAIILGKSSKPEIRHYENAFTP